MSPTQDALYHRQRRLEARQSGYCTRCYGEKAAPGRSSCLKCLEVVRRYHQSPGGRIVSKRYLKSVKGVLKIAKHNKVYRGLKRENKIGGRDK